MVSDNFSRLCNENPGIDERATGLHGVLVEVFPRRYALCNHVIRGRATYGVGRGRKQNRDLSLMPTIVDIMETDIDRDSSSEVGSKTSYSKSHVSE